MEKYFYVATLDEGGETSFEAVMTPEHLGRMLEADEIIQQMLAEVAPRPVEFAQDALSEIDGDTMLVAERFDPDSFDFGELADRLRDWEWGDPECPGDGGGPIIVIPICPDGPDWPDGPGGTCPDMDPVVDFFADGPVVLPF